MLGTLGKFCKVSSRPLTVQSSATSFAFLFDFVAAFFSFDFGVESAGAWPSMRFEPSAGLDGLEEEYRL